MLAILLCGALIALPLTYQQGKGNSATALQDEHALLVEEIRAENAQALRQFEVALTEVEMDWEVKHSALKSRVREALLNTGVPLEILNTIQEPEPEPEKIDYTISQETFMKLKDGMSYDEVVDALGREGENTLNMLEPDGSGTSAYVWKWTNNDDSQDRLNVTFVNLKLTDKHYTAFKL